MFVLNLIFGCLYFWGLYICRSPFLQNPFVFSVFISLPLYFYYTSHMLVSLCRSIVKLDSTLFLYLYFVKYLHDCIIDIDRRHRKRTGNPLYQKVIFWKIKSLINFKREKCSTESASDWNIKEMTTGTMKDSRKKECEPLFGKNNNFA